MQNCLKWVVLGCGLWTAVLLPAFAQTPSPLAEAPHRLVARALGDTPLFTDLRELCDGIGGRPTGSPALQRALEWGARKFRDAGVSVAVEPFTIPNLWLPVSSEASAIAPEPFTIRVAAAPFTPSTS